MYGASARSLFVYADTPGAYDQLVIAEIASLSPGVLRRLLISADEATDKSHYIVTTGPSPNDRTIPERKTSLQHSPR